MWISKISVHEFNKYFINFISGRFAVHTPKHSETHNSSDELALIPCSEFFSSSKSVDMGDVDTIRQRYYKQISSSPATASRAAFEDVLDTP
ncbi:hypothetical protein G9A89_021131 [Geosiphon pyriformis]|nr:hypothetical protein G9A89_021131 [Geosiphon pyriformis]